MVVEPTWFERDLAVLAAAVSLFNEVGLRGAVTVKLIADRSGRDPQEVLSALLAMQEEYVTLSFVLAGGDPNPQKVTSVTPAARRAVGQWPSPENLSEQIIAALRTATEHESDLDRRSKLRSAGETLGGVGRDVLVRVLSSVIAGHV